MHLTRSPTFPLNPAACGKGDTGLSHAPWTSTMATSFEYGSSDSFATGVLPTTTATSPEKCAYRTGKCFNVRAYKRNGKPHKLCAFHREKANLNQMKLDQKKRLRRGSCEDDDGNSSTATAEPPRKQPFVARPSLGVFHACPTRLDDAPPVLAVDELDFFCDAMSPRQTKLLQDQRAAATRSSAITLEVVV